MRSPTPGRSAQRRLARKLSTPGETDRLKNYSVGVTSMG